MHPPSPAVAAPHRGSSVGPSHPRRVAASDHLRLLPELTARQLDFRVRRLARIFSLNSEDAEDLRQSALLEIHRASLRFEPDLGSRTAYFKGVLSHWYNATCVRLRREADRRDRLAWSSVDGGALPVLGEPEADSSETIALRIDLHAAIARLPGHLLPVACGLLAGHSVCEIARWIGLHRGSVYRMVGQLREHFFDLGVDSRDTHAGRVDG